MRSHNGWNTLVQFNDKSDNAYKDYYHCEMWTLFNISTRRYMHYMPGGRSCSQNSGSEKFNSKFLHVRGHRSFAASHNAHMCSEDFHHESPNVYGRTPSLAFDRRTCYNCVPGHLNYEFHRPGRIYCPTYAPDYIIPDCMQ